MKIENYLSQLLYTHECVVVPEFGGFLTRHYPAEINSATHMFVPPSKRISFNLRLRQNDGLLTMHVAKQQQLSYQAAQHVVMRTVAEWQRILDSGQQLQLHDIGRFYYNNEGALQFKPSVDVNFSTETFGMGVFRAAPLNQQQRLVQMNAEVQQPFSTLLPEKKHKRRRDWLRSAAILIPIAGLLYLGVIKNDLEMPLAQNLSSLFNPRVLQTPTSNESLTVAPEVPAVIEIQEYITQETETPAIVEATDAAKPDVAHVNETNPEVAVANPETSTNHNSGFSKPFQVIVGSFSTDYNAEKLVETLGGNAFALNAGKGRLVKVSMGGFDTREEAAAFIASNSNSIPQGAWIFKQ
jgi:hypothetical protein